MGRGTAHLGRSIRLVVLGAVLGCVLVACAPNGTAAPATSVGVVSPTSTPAEPPTAAPTQPSMDAPRPQSLQHPRVAMIGDSLSVSAEDEIRAALGTVGFEVIGFNAASGRRMVRPSQSIPSGLSAVGELKSSFQQEPDMWIVALGTNDVGAQAGREELVADIDILLSAIGSTPVLWINVYIDHLADESWAFDLLVQQRTTQRAGLAVGDWFNPAQLDGSLAGDGIHLTPTGKTRFAGAIASAAQRIAATAGAQAPGGTASPTTVGANASATTAP